MNRSVFYYSVLTQHIKYNKDYLELLWHLTLFHVAQISRTHLLFMSVQQITWLWQRVNTAKQISYSDSAPNRCIFQLSGGKNVYTAVASPHGSSVKRHEHGNVQLRQGSWHV